MKVNDMIIMTNPDSRIKKTAVILKINNTHTKVQFQDGEMVDFENFQFQKYNPILK